MALLLKSTEMTLNDINWPNGPHMHLPGTYETYLILLLGPIDPNMKSGCHYHPIGIYYLYDAIFKMAASEGKLYVFVYYSASRIDRDMIWVSKPMFFCVKNPMMTLKIQYDSWLPLG